MHNPAKKMFTTARLVYENLGSGSGSLGTGSLESEKAPVIKSDEETLNQITEVVRLSYEEQLKMMNVIREQLKPIAEDIDKYWSLVTEMHRQVQSTGQPQMRDLPIYGQTVQVHMDGNSTYWETVDGKPVNIYEWMKENSQKYKN